jgi:hypothetical protein
MDERKEEKNKSRDGETAHQQYARGGYGKTKQQIKPPPSRKHRKSVKTPQVSNLNPNPDPLMARTNSTNAE